MICQILFVQHRLLSRIMLSVKTSKIPSSRHQLIQQRRNRCWRIIKSFITCFFIVNSHHQYFVSFLLNKNFYLSNEMYQYLFFRSFYGIPIFMYYNFWFVDTTAGIRLFFSSLYKNTTWTCVDHVWYYI
jgi:hypothetical protein